MPNYLNGFNKQGLIKWGGESSENFGMVVSAAPAFDKPIRKQTVYSVPGRNGSIIFQQDAFEDVERAYEVWIAEQTEEDSGGTPVSGTLPERIADFTAWLNSKPGYQELEDSFELDYFRLAYYSGGNNFTNQMMAVGHSTITFMCRPERFLKSAKTAVSVSNGTILNNPTKFTSKPLIHIEVSSPATIGITLGGNTISAQVADYINIDCDTMSAYRLPTENKNDKITGSFPKMPPGSNAVAITGSPSTVTIVPRYFTI